MAPVRKYPAGIQSFEIIRKEGYVYIDKTPLIYKMITEGKPYFLSRPRRFGKSLLVSTLAAIFEGKRELFEAFTTKNGIEQPQLFIATTDWEWEEHPVIRFDFSAGDLMAIEQLDTLIDQTLKRYEQRFGITVSVPDTNIRMINLLRAAYKSSGRGVVVLVDEYDNFILHALGDKEKTDLARQRFQNLFGPLKEMDDYLKFVFITGISKFSQMGIFSKLNQLKNISMVPAYETLCGISEKELTTQLRSDIDTLARTNNKSYDEQLTELKRMYDGYHFSLQQTEIYNPFSVLNAFSSQMIDNYWFASGTSGAVIDLLSQMPRIDLTDINGVECEAGDFDKAFDSYATPLPLLYQSGYLTIKKYDRELELYTLGFPNHEVSRGFANCLYQYITQRQNTDDLDKNKLLRAYRVFRRDDKLAPFIEAIKTFFAGVPYQLEQDNKNEHYFHSLLYTLLVAFGADVIAEDSMSKGRSDLTLFMPKAIYVMEIKYDKTVKEALAQIDERGYVEKYRRTYLPITKVGIVFSSQERNIVDWKAVSA